MKPVIDPARRVPVALRVKVRRIRQDATDWCNRACRATEWVSSMVTIVKLNKLRICIDPRRLNEAVLREHYPLLTVEEVVSRIPRAKYYSTFDAASGFWQIPLDEASSRLTTFNTPFGR